MKRMLKNTSAWLPIAMSGLALVFTLTYLAIFGNIHHEDEGLAARIFQVLMGGQVFVIAFFLAKYFPKKPKQVLEVLALQILTALLAFTPVYLLEL